MMEAFHHVIILVIDVVIIMIPKPFFANLLNHSTVYSHHYTAIFQVFTKKHLPDAQAFKLKGLTPEDRNNIDTLIYLWALFPIFHLLARALRAN